jgi:hypothetical protein
MQDKDGLFQSESDMPGDFVFDERVVHVMLPDSLDEHRARLERAGFRRVVPWFQASNFGSLAALA